MEKWPMWYGQNAASCKQKGEKKKKGHELLIWVLFAGCMVIIPHYTNMVIIPILNNFDKKLN